MIRLPVQMRDAMVAHARFCAPYEACGLVAVDGDGALRMVYCLTNLHRSSRRFTVAPQEHFGALQHAERLGWTIGGAFHSHPRAPARPSARDITEALDPTWVHFVVGPLSQPEVRAYRIARGVAEELEIAIVPAGS